MSDQQRLLWHSNAPHAPTGYGNQTSLFVPRLAEHYETAISAFYGVEGNMMPWKGLPVFPALGKSHGNETILQHAGVWFGEQLRSGVVLTLMDVWVLNAAIWGELNLACWVPIDHQPVPPPIVRFLRDTGAVPIAMSEFGKRELEAAGLEDVLFVPHGVDTRTYSPQDRADSREQLGIDQDVWLVGMVAANKGNSPSRKAFPEALQAFKAFHDLHDDARLYMHTEVMGAFDGVQLIDLCHAVELDTDLVIFPDQYRVMHMPYPEGHMARVYSAMDVFLSPSMGEGFGIPTIEAQACGTPVIVSDFSAQPETCGSGWTVDAACRFYTPLRSWQIMPDVSDILDALKRAKNLSRQQMKMHREKARNFALRYDVDAVFKDEMLPAVRDVFERFGAPPPDLPAEAEDAVDAEQVAA